MIVRKGNETYVLNSQIQIDAFISCGFVEVKEDREREEIPSPVLDEKANENTEVKTSSRGRKKKS